MVRSRARFVALVAALGACRATAASRPIEIGDGRDPCLIPAREAFDGTATLGTEGTIDLANLHRAPRSPADSLVFAHLYETLVKVTCDGRLVPALAERWSLRDDTSARVWTLDLRTAHAGEVSVSPEDVIDAWRSRRSATGSERDPRALAIESVGIESNRTVTVRFRDPHPDGPRILADPYFAVSRSTQDSTAIGGTGSFPVVHAGDPTPGDGSVTLVPPVGTGGTRMLRIVSSGDPRDLIDRGVNVVRTRDRRSIAYAATRRDSRTEPLPADHAYILVAPARAAAASVVSPSAGAIDTTSYAAVNDPRWESLRTALSRDVLRMNAPQRTDGWWLTPDVASRCGITIAARAAWTTPRSPTRSRRLVFDAGDSIGAALARRLVVLAAADAPPSPEADAVRALLPELAAPAPDRLVAWGASDAELASGLLAGGDAAYLVSLPRRVLDPCTHWRTASAMAPWLRPGHVAFIVESGPVLITNAGAPPLTIDWIGTLRVVGPAGKTSPQR